MWQVKDDNGNMGNMSSARMVEKYRKGVRKLGRQEKEIESMMEVKNEGNQEMGKRGEGGKKGRKAARARAQGVVAAFARHAVSL